MPQPRRNREPTTLETMESTCMDAISAAGNEEDRQAALAQLGLTHLMMDTGKTKQAFQEIIASMRGRRIADQLVIAAVTLATIYNGGVNSATHEHITALVKDKKWQDLVL